MFERFARTGLPVLTLATLSPAVAAATDLAVYDSADLSQPIGIIQTIRTSGSGAAHYDFYSASSHATGVNLQNPNANVWVHESTQSGEYSFGFAFGRDNDGAPLNSASFAFRIVGSDSSPRVVVSDDPGEAVETSPASFQGTFRYGNNTDGIMVSGLTGTSWTIIIDAVDFGNVTHWFAASGATPDFSDDLSLTLGREYRITPLGNTVSTQPVDPRDTDSDGVLDDDDQFPCDPTASGMAFAPAEGSSSALLFEDHWPEGADLDFNDVVVSYNYSFRTTAAGLVSSARATIDVLAVGGEFHNGLGLALPVPADQVQANLRVDGGAPQPLTPSAQDADFTVTLSQNLRDLFGGMGGIINSDPALPVQAGHTLEVELTFAQPTALAVSDAPYDLFIFRSRVPSKEIHRTPYSGTARMDTSLFGTGDDGSSPGRHFVDSTGLPFVLEIPPSPPYPAEQRAISELYPDIVGFATSGGTQNRDFYESTVDLSAAYDLLNRPAPSAPRTLAADTSCLPVMGSTSQIPGSSCYGILSLGASTGNGAYWIDPDEAGGVDPFLVYCDMTRDGGGWIGLQLDHSDGLIVGEWDRSNPWYKCADDSARHFDWITESQVSPDYASQRDTTIDLRFINPATGLRFTSAQLSVLRGLVTELNPGTRMVGVTSDDDGGNYESGGGHGHEILVRGPGGQPWHLVTRGEDGQCGGASGSWPYSGTASGYRLWHPNALYTAVGGDLSVSASALGALPAHAIIPSQVRLQIQTGGGAAFGWEERTFLVR